MKRLERRGAKVLWALVEHLGFVRLFRRAGKGGPITSLMRVNFGFRLYENSYLFFISVHKFSLSVFRTQLSSCPVRYTLCTVQSTQKFDYNSQ